MTPNASQGPLGFVPGAAPEPRRIERRRLERPAEKSRAKRTMRTGVRVRRGVRSVLSLDSGRGRSCGDSGPFGFASLYPDQNSRSFFVGAGLAPGSSALTGIGAELTARILSAHRPVGVRKITTPTYSSPSSGLTLMVNR